LFGKYIKRNNIDQAQPSAALLTRRTECGNYQRTAGTIITLTYFSCNNDYHLRTHPKSSALTQTREVCNPVLPTVPAYILQR